MDGDGQVATEPGLVIMFLRTRFLPPPLETRPQYFRSQM
jgi:hypothetical protein